MALSANETYLKAKEASSNTINFVNKINNILSNLNDFSSDLIMINNKINESIIADDIISCSKEATDSLKKEIENTRNSAKKIAKEAVNNCNSYISFLESDYNNSLGENESKIYLQRVNIQVNENGVSVSVSGEKTDVKNVRINKPVYTGIATTSTGTINNNIKQNEVKSVTETNKVVNNTEIVQSNTNQKVVSNNVLGQNNTVFNETIDSSANNIISASSININNPDEIDKYLNSVLGNIDISDFNSKEIDNWNEIIDKFLIKNNLRDKVSSISIENKQVVWMLSNGKNYANAHIKSVDELISIIKFLVTLENTIGD